MQNLSSGWKSNSGRNGALTPADIAEHDPLFRFHLLQLHNALY